MELYMGDTILASQLMPLSLTESYNDSSELISDGTLSSRSNELIHDEDAALNFSTTFTYAFEIESRFVGKLIGKGGRNIKRLNRLVGHGSVFVAPHNFKKDCNIVFLEGDYAGLEVLINSIRELFPIPDYPTIDLSNVLVSPMMPMDLNLTISCKKSIFFPSDSLIHVSWIKSTGHIFVHQLSALAELRILHDSLNAFYDSIELVPFSPSVGMFCSANIMGSWYRAEILQIYQHIPFETTSENFNETAAGLLSQNGATPFIFTAYIKLIDFGVFTQCTLTSFQPLVQNFLNISAYANECFMSNLIPCEGESVFSLESCKVLRGLVKSQFPPNYLALPLSPSLHNQQNKDTIETCQEHLAENEESPEFIAHIDSYTSSSPSMFPTMGTTTNDETTIPFITLYRNNTNNNNPENILKTNEPSEQNATANDVGNDLQYKSINELLFERKLVGWTQDPIL